MATADQYKTALLYSEWDKVTKPILKKLEEMGTDIELTCSDPRIVERIKLLERKRGYHYGE